MRIRLEVIGPNFTRLYVNDHSLWYSYNTCIAFATPFGCWITDAKFGPTTNRHKKQVYGEVVSDTEFQSLLLREGYV